MCSGLVTADVRQKMKTIDYFTYFDVTTAGFKSWQFPAFGLIFVAIGLLLPTLISSGVFRKSSPNMNRWFPSVFLGFAIFWTLTSFISTFTDYRRAVTAMQKNQAMIVEGLVTNFQPLLKSESFVVQGVKFKYSDYIITAGFNNMASHGGPISEGLPVRIWYLGDEILRLDIKKPNHTLHTNGSPRGSFKSAALASPAQSRMLLAQPPRLRLAPLCCHPPLPESRG